MAKAVGSLNDHEYPLNLINFFERGQGKISGTGMGLYLPRPVRKKI